ncbi:MAG TPA: amidohydrolase family protein [Kiritimatiellia bacterium]|nr:amidohydrolase family protein [Kiritimatiellia bacterium]HMO97500.1 amidohydrolase family protein [Kiritimatiellia bacterium]HMP96309.1 amidohydrolase family protein [Kiritimatiellia bacterium]
MTGDILIRNALVWPSADRDALEGGSVLIRDGRIVEAGRFSARAHTVIDADGCLVMPGLIQGHIHMCQTLLRGIAEDLALLPWLRGYIWPSEAAHQPESIRASALLTCAELIRGGTTAFLSIETTRHTDDTFQAVHEAGLAGAIGHCLMDETGGYPPIAVDNRDALAYCDVLLDRWGDHPRLKLAVAPRFVLSCSESNMRDACAYARSRGLLLHTHSSEQQEEITLVKERTGRCNICYLNDVGLTGADVGLAHCVHVRPEERRFLVETGTHVLHCPSANFKLASGIAPIPEYLAQDINVAIGGDGAPCNNRLDQFLEMRLAGMMQKIRLGPEALSARAIVKMATEGGAKLLGWENEMGTLDPGKRANLILVDQSGFHTLPSTDPATNVVYSCTANDVVMTMVDGKILYEDGHLTTIDEDKLKADVRRERKKLLERAGLA